MISEETFQRILKAQKNELTETYIYRELAKRMKDEHNRNVLEQIAKEEESHYKQWKKLSNVEVKPNLGKIRKYFLISRIFGITFAVKWMEGVEKWSQVNYAEIAKEVPEALKIKEKEMEHEAKLIEMINERKLAYISSIVLGLNDALIELTGALAGLTLALQNNRIIAMAGLITGISASLSMAVSEYLSTKSEKDENNKENEKNPKLAAFYTGLAYLATVIILISPYLFIKNVFLALGITLVFALSIIAFFNYYLSVTKEFSFKKHFQEMAILSMGVALFSFFIGYIIKLVFGIEI